MKIQSAYPGTKTFLPMTLVFFQRVVGGSVLSFLTAKQDVPGTIPGAGGGRSFSRAGKVAPESSSRREIA